QLQNLGASRRDAGATAPVKAPPGMCARNSEMGLRRTRMPSPPPEAPASAAEKAIKCPAARNAGNLTWSADHKIRCGRSGPSGLPALEQAAQQAQTATQDKSQRPFGAARVGASLPSGWPKPSSPSRSGPSGLPALEHVHVR